MQIKEINRETTGIFSQQHVRMVNRPHEMEKYVQRLFSEEMFAHQIEAKGFEFQQEQRDALFQALQNQYKNITQNRPDFWAKRPFITVTEASIVSAHPPLSI